MMDLIKLVRVGQRVPAVVDIFYFFHDPTPGTREKGLHGDPGGTT